jgi:hypothetical protein
VNLKNKNVTLHGKEYAILAGKPTPIPNRNIHLLNVLGKEPDYSLWLIEISEDKQNIKLWSYEGTDSEELIKKLLEELVLWGACLFLLQVKST